MNTLFDSSGQPKGNFAIQPDIIRSSDGGDTRNPQLLSAELASATSMTGFLGFSDKAESAPEAPFGREEFALWQCRCISRERAYHRWDLLGTPFLETFLRSL